MFASGWDAFASLVDVLIVAAVLYRVLLVIKDTRAFQMLIGLLILNICSVLSFCRVLYLHICQRSRH